MLETQTSTQSRGIHLRPRLPDITFDDSLPREHAGTRARTAWVNLVGVFANVGERAFIRSGVLMQPHVEGEAHAEELAAFMTQEAFHSRVHERMNRVLRDRGYPVEAYRAYLQAAMDAIVETGGHRMLVAMALAGEQAIGVFGDAVLEHPASLAAWDARVRQLFQWHAYEEVEHTAALFDAFHVAVGDPDTAYRLRMWGAAYVVLVLAASWGAGFHAFLEHEGPGEGTRLEHWRDLGTFLFGEDGLLRGSGENLRAYLRRDFHPWEGRDAHARLARHAHFVREDWEKADRVGRRSSAPADSAMDAATLRAPVRPLKEALGFARFAVRLGVDTVRFVRGTSGPTSRPQPAVATA